MDIYNILKSQYELYLQTIRNQQKLLMNQLLQLCNTYNQCSTIQQLDTLLQQISTLQHKLSQLHTHTNKIICIINQRISYINTYIDNQYNNNHNEHNNVVATNELRLCRIIIDYCARNGYMNTMESIISHPPYKCMNELCDIEQYIQIHRIKQNIIAKHDCTSALLWCGEYRSRLNKYNIDIEYELHLYEFIHMIQQSHKDTSKQYIIQYGRKYFGSTYINETTDNNGTLIQQISNKRKIVGEIVALLLFHNYNDSSNHTIQLDTIPAWHKYKYYCSDERWHELADKLNHAYLTINGFSGLSLINMMLYSGMSALHTPYCEKYNTFDTIKSNDKSNATSTIHNRNCPTCTSSMNQLSNSNSTLYTIQYNNSKLICSGTGIVLDDKYQAFVLPNGRVYCKQAINAMTVYDHTDDISKVICPHTKHIYNKSDVRPAYVL